MFLYTYVCANIHIYIYKYTYIHIYLYIYKYINICTHTLSSIHAHTHQMTPIITYTYTYLPATEKRNWQHLTKDWTPKKIQQVWVGAPMANKQSPAAAKRRDGETAAHVEQGKHSQKSDHHSICRVKWL